MGSGLMMPTKIPTKFYKRCIDNLNLINSPTNPKKKKCNLFLIKLFITK